MVKIFGCLYDESGVNLDLEKVDAVHALPTPTNVTECHIVVYLNPFIPGLSTLTAPLCELLKKAAEFNWDASYQATFQCVKDAIIGNTTLQYFNAYHPITFQVDASQVGLGAALPQDIKPVAFASKALTEVEYCYANIECEMLAVVLRVEQFKTYVYGRSFTSGSDCKPL